MCNSRKKTILNCFKHKRLNKKSSKVSKGKKVQSRRRTLTKMNLRLKCLLCCKDKRIERMSVSICCHIFCTKCLFEAARAGTLCPTCGQVVVRRRRQIQNRFKPIEAPPAEPELQLPGSGAGRGGGTGGAIRDSGGGLGRYGAAQEESYFYEKNRRDTENLKQKQKEQEQAIKQKPKKDEDD